MNSEKLKSQVPWREKPLLPLSTAGEIAGVSSASLRRLAAKGEIQLVSLAGRTLVDTASFIAMLERVQPWISSSRTVKATAARHVTPGENA